MTVLLTRRALLLAKIESVIGQDSNPTTALDAVLVSDPDFVVDPNILERDFVRNDLSPLGHSVGRKLASMTFTVEARSNGLTNSGNVNDAAILGRLIKACGYSETGVTGAGTVGAVINTIGNTVNPSAWAAGGVSTALAPIHYTLTVVLGGASATAELRATADNVNHDANVLRNETFSATTDSASGTIVVDASDPLSVLYTVGGTWIEGEAIDWNVGGFTGTTLAPSTPTPTTVGDVLDVDIAAAHADISAAGVAGVVTVTFTNDMDGTAITSGATPMTLGNSGGTATPTWTGDLTLGDSWTVKVSPVGIVYDPISTGFESITLYLYFDGMLHILPGGFGTFSLNAEAGSFGSVSFEFTGQFVTPTDVTLPTDSIFEETQPAQVELGQLLFDGFAITANALTYDQNNTIVPRPDINGTDGFNGTRITERSPEGGLDPEADLVANFDFWDKFAVAKEMEFQMRIGTTPGNTITIDAPKVQASGLTYQSRDGIRVYDMGLKFSRKVGNDEVAFHFG